ncbi:MAG: threonine--tRNA ligase [Ruminococcaceae bacterium]|nr:threonine--tRNA ligase [Oscillospiraceae bacterium]
MQVILTHKLYSKKGCATARVHFMKVIAHDGSISDISFKEEEGRKAFWHTASHILAQAVKRLYPETKLTIGPAIKEGFYYDFDRETPFTAEDFDEIEAEMKKIVKENLPLKRTTLSREEALNKIKSLDEPYKVELLSDIPEGDDISFFEQGEFIDLCAGPHVAYTSVVKAFKLTKVAGAYWRGDEKNKMLSRIYGIAFPSAGELKEYLDRIEEAKKRDHRKIGKELELFEIMDEGPGFPFFLPKGMIVKNELMKFWREIHTREGYVEISTPMMLTKTLWETSGHWAHYSQNMYTSEIDESTFAVKPMNCPGSLLVYNMKPHSYKELPMRVGELGLVHRHEKAGALHGLMRVRCFTQDDAHIFMTKEQITDEIKGVVKLIDEVYNLFGFKYSIELSTMPEDHLGSIEDWDMATNGLKAALDELGMAYEINEGDGAFYGPKIDFHLEDCLGRTWQCGTIQLDFQLPMRFDIDYIGADGQKHRPIMIHRVVFGSIERFIGILTEHYAGKFPLWLAPVQAKILPITDAQRDYALSVAEKLKAKGIRCEVDDRSESLNYKVREAQLQKIRYILVVGEKEATAGTVAIRGGAVLPVDELTAKLCEEIDNKVSTL